MAGADADAMIQRQAPDTETPVVYTIKLAEPYAVLQVKMFKYTRSKAMSPDNLISMVALTLLTNRPRLHSQDQAAPAKQFWMHQTPFLHTVGAGVRHLLAGVPSGQIVAPKWHRSRSPLRPLGIKSFGSICWLLQPVNYIKCSTFNVVHWLEINAVFEDRNMSVGSCTTCTQHVQVVSLISLFFYFCVVLAPPHRSDR